MRQRGIVLFHCLRGGRRVGGWRYAVRYAVAVQRGWPNVGYVSTGKTPQEAVDLGRDLARRYDW